MNGKYCAACPRWVCSHRTASVHSRFSTGSRKVTSKPPVTRFSTDTSTNYIASADVSSKVMMQIMELMHAYSIGSGEEESSGTVNVSAY